MQFRTRLKTLMESKSNNIYTYLVSQWSSWFTGDERSYKTAVAPGSGCWKNDDISSFDRSITFFGMQVWVSADLEAIGLRSRGMIKCTLVAEEGRGVTSDLLIVDM